MSLNEVRGASSDTGKASDANSTLDLPSEVLGIDYKRVFESAPALFLLLGADESFRILNASDGYLRVTYTDRETILGRSLFEVFPDKPEDLGATGTANLRSSLLRVLDSGRPDTMAVQKYDIRRPLSETGGFEERYWSPVNVPVFGPDGRMLFIVHRVEDVTELLRTNRALTSVTERKATEQALREREEQLRLATEAAEVGLWDVDVVTDTLFWPPRVKAMFGISPEVPVSMADFYSGLHPADRERTGEAYAAACDPERRALYDVEYRTVGKEDGLIRWVAAKGRGVFDGGGRCVRVIGTAIDITARKRVDQALSDADRRKDEFLAMLAHELRNPLAPIGNASELLSRSLKDDARAQTAIGVIKRQVVQMTRLVDDLLDVSRITQGLIQLKKRPVDIATVVAQTIETVEPQLREKRHKLSTTASSYEPLFVMGDFARLTQCVGNVLVNAIKYTEPGGEISVRTGSDEANAYIEISDNGTGIAPELLSRVFELFVQSERTLDRAQGGLGIGLAVVRRLVEMHDGEVCARSAGLGLGSSFEIRLPRIARPVSTAAAAVSFKAEPRRVLVVDDNADAADSLSVLLTFQGHLTQVAYSAQEALACVETFRPDVGLLDIGLPEMNGYELATKLRAITGLDGMRLVALTGYGQAEDYQRTQAAGFDDHLVKPVDLAKLERALVGLSENRMDSSGDEGV